MPDDGFVDVPNDGFIDVPHGTQGSTLLERLGRQAVAGIARFPTDTVLGIPGALGHAWSARMAEMIGNRIDSELGTRDVNVFDRNNTAGDYSEFAVRNGVTALVGLPARAAGLITNSIKPGMRLVEALTPVTLPLTRGNIVANAVGSNVVTAGVQGLNELDQNTRAQPVAAVPPSDGFVDAAPTTPVPLNDGFVDAPAEQPRSTYGVIRDNLAPVMLGAAVLLGGAGAARQVMRNRAANAAMDGGNVAQTQARTDNYTPGVVEEATRRNLDDTASGQAAFTRAQEAGYVTPQAAQTGREGFATNINAAAAVERSNEALRTGNLLDSGVSIVSPEQHEFRVANLGKTDPNTYALFHNAATAADEIDSRSAIAANNAILVQRGANPATLPTARFLESQTDAQLAATLAQGRANPAVAALLQERQAMNAGLRQFEVQERLISQDMANKWANAHPNYLHDTTPGNSPFTRRDLSTRTPEEMSDPIVSMNERIRDSIAAALENRQRRALADAATQISARTPNGLKEIGIGRVGDYKTISANRAPDTQIVRVQDGGNVLGVEVIAPIARAFTTTPRLVMPILGGLSNMFTNLTVGKLAALAGAVQAPTTAAFSTTAMMASRPKGTSFGIVDNAMLKYTGRNLPIGDPTALLQTAGAAAAGVAAELSRGIASQVQRSIIADAWLARTLGPRQAAALAKRFGDYYSASTVAQARNHGSAGSGVNYNVHGERTMKFAARVSTPEYRNLLPKDKAAQGLQALTEHLAFYGRQVTPPVLARTWQMFGSMLDIVSNSAQLAYVKQNQGRLDAQALHGTARRLAGDPGARGASVGAQMLTSAVPFSNTTLQSIRAHAKAFTDNPVRYAATYAVVGASLPLYSLLSAMYADEQEGGDRYINHLMNSPPRELVTGAMMYIPGVAPSHGMRIPTDPTIAPWLAAGVGMLPTLFDIPSRIKNGELAPLREELNTMLTDRAATLGRVSLGAAFDPFEGLSNILTGFGYTNQPRRSDVGAPGLETASTFGGLLHEDTERRVRALTGIMGTTLLTVVDRAAQTGGLGSGIASWQEDLLSRNRIAAPLLPGTRTENQRGMIGEITQPMENRFADIARNVLPDVARQGTVGAGAGTRGAMTGRQPPPESIMPILFDMRATYNRKDMEVYRQQREGARQAIVDIRSSVNRFPDERTMRNAINREVEIIRRNTASMYNVMSARERELTRTYGRRIDLSRIDPQRGIEQFERTQGN